MRVTTNIPLIKRRARWGTYASVAGMIVLIAGLVVSFRPELIWVSLIAIILGFILAQFGSYHLRRYGRTPRPDQMLEEALKGFDDRYRLYTWCLPSPYVLLTPQGVYSFVTRDQTGQISVSGSQWRSRLNPLRWLLTFSQEGLGNPTSEALDMAGRLSNWVKSRLPDVAANIQPVVVFIDERVQLTANEPMVPVLEAKALKKWLRGTGKGDNLKSADLRALEELFDQNAQAVSK